MDNNYEKEKGMRFSPSRSSSKTSCCVPSCKSLAKKDPTVRFHSFPHLGETVQIINKFQEKQIFDRKLLWEKVVKIEKNRSKAARVCSLHFKKDDYILPDYPSKRRMLSKTAVPSVNLPQTELEAHESEAFIERKHRDLKRDKKTLKKSLTKEIVRPENVEQVIAKAFNRPENVIQVIIKDVNKPGNQTKMIAREKPKLSENFKQIIVEEVNEPGIFRLVTVKKDDILKNIEHMKNNEKTLKRPNLQKEKNVNENKRTKNEENMCKSATIRNINEMLDMNMHEDKEVQVEFDLYHNFISNEKDLDIMTGLSNFKILNTLEQIIIIQHHKEHSVLSIKDKIILTLLKLKQNVDYEVLSRMFRINTDEDCKNIFLKMLDCLSTSLKFAIRWPEKEDIMKSIPAYFKDFCKVKAIIHFININVQKPEIPDHEIGSPSSSNNVTTVKLMTAVSPMGLVSYISKPYIEKTSGKAIFEDTKLIELIKPGDELITNGNLTIDDICSQYKVKVMRIPLSQDKDVNELSSKEANINTKISKALEFVKKSNNQIKVFKILNTNIPSHLASRLKQILTIAYAIINLKSDSIS